MFFIKSSFCLLFFIVVLLSNIKAEELNAIIKQQKAANLFLDSIQQLPKSDFWININSALFLKNLRRNINQPQLIYGGNNTNFCGYAAMSYSCISNHPLTYVRFMIELYKNGKAHFNRVYFTPSFAVKKAAGLLKFKGELDINYADQIWFLTLADHFKGYLNWINLNYQPGDEDKLWAATNFAKFNRMLRKMCTVKTHSVGSDLLRPSIKNIPEFLNNKLALGEVYVYLNNTILHKKNHNKIRKRIPTHFVFLLSIHEKDGLITFTYWDYGFKTLQQLPVHIVKKIIFGITWTTKE